MDDLFNLLAAYVGDDYDSSMDTFLQSLLNAAQEEVRNTAFPFGYPNDTVKEEQESRVLSRYSNVILKIAEYHFDKIGKEGILGATENGTYSYYENAGTPNSYLRQVLPEAMIV